MQTDMTGIVQKIMKRIGLIQKKKEKILIAIDGRCASGKTTLAKMLGSCMDCTIFHMDDYFLRPGQRTKERLSKPGGNVDHERFREEILQPLRQGNCVISYRPYDCHMQMLLPPVTVNAAQIVIVEGSYSCHPALWQYYDLHVFLTVDPQKQLSRIAERNSGSLQAFTGQWIPLEETYFQAAEIQKHCELCFET